MFPDLIQQYVKSLYSNLNAYVTGPSWNSNIFRFKRGVFQGDPLSPIIFLLAFNPILQYLKTEETHGYNLAELHYITTPFADDFNLITTNKATHQRIINKITEKCKSMNLTLKPVKYKSLSLKSGKPSEITFRIGDFEIPTIKDEPHSFFGSIITYSGKSQETFLYLKDKLTSGLNRIQDSKIRNEYKLSIYKDYFLPSLRFSLTVHDITKTQLNTLNQITDNYLKKWCGLPPSATNAVLHMSEGLGIKSIDHMYKESHCNAYASSMVKADVKVRNCLKSQYTRELSWKRKFSTIVYAENMYQKAQSEIPPATNPIDNLKIVKQKIKFSIAKEIHTLWISKIETLVLQGNLLKLMSEENSNITWKSIIHNLPRKLLRFGLNSITNTLPVNSNLALWGKTLNQACALCGRKETLLHVLNGCPIMLDQGRYTYRHNNILSVILKALVNMYSDTSESYKIYSDIEGRHALGGGTIPPDVLPTNEKPDIVIMKPGEITIIELSVPFESNIKIRHEFKCNKYAMLISDLKQTGRNVTFYAIEVGSRGFISNDNKDSLKHIFKSLSQKSHKGLLHDISKMALVSSFVVFFSKYSKDWHSETSL